MDATMDDHQTDRAPKSVESAWQHGQELWSSASAADAWQSFRNMLGALPGWALVVLAVALLGLIAESTVVVIPLAAAAFLAATFYTVKRAVLSALREYDSERS